MRDDVLPDLLAGNAVSPWTLILRAVGSRDSRAAAALDDLLRLFRPAAVAYVRSRLLWADVSVIGDAEASAEDIVQKCYLSVVERRSLQEGKWAEGARSFKAWFRTVLHHAVVSHFREISALKRGGGIVAQVYSGCDTMDSGAGAETPVVIAGGLEQQPDRVLDRQMFHVIMDQAMERLQAAQLALGREDIFFRLKPLLTLNEADATIEKLAEELGMTGNALRQRKKRLADAWRETLLRTACELLHCTVESAEAELMALVT
jgi:RNA polymerase sigma factor (sigma-70 family)